MAVLRLFLLGLLLLGLATGFRNQWLQVNWDAFLEDIGLMRSNSGEPFDFNKWLIGEPSSPSDPDGSGPASSNR